MKKRRKIKADWIQDPMIKPWAERRDADIYCKACNSSLKASSGKADLISHSKTAKHLEASNAIMYTQPKIDQIYLEDKYLSKKAEIKLALFIVEHNLAFAVADHMTKVCQNIFPDSNVVSTMSLGRTKANVIVKNLIGSRQFTVVCELLKNNPFSLCVDESTDVANIKSMCMVVRVFIDFEIKDLCFGLLTVSKCDTESLYSLIVNHFQDNGIDFKKNLIGFAADGAPVMTGRNILWLSF